MKKTISIAAAFAMVLGMVSCQKDLADRKGDCTVSFCMEIPGDVVTKADMSDGSKVDQLVWEVYSKSSNTPLYRGEINEFTINSAGRKQFVLELKLVNHVEYDLLFWAQKKGTGYYDTSDLRAVSTDYKVYDNTLGSYINAKANDETRDAFYGSRPGFIPTGVPASETVELRRPFAQINFGSAEEDWEVAQPFINGFGLKSKFEMTNVPTTLNVLDGSVSGSSDVIFDYSLCPASETEYGNDHIDYNGLTYAWVGMNYIFAPKEKDTMNEVTGSFVHKSNNEGSPLIRKVPSVPFRQNYKTNILGNMFTGDNTFKVIILPDFFIPDPSEAPDYNIIDPVGK